MKLLWNTAGTFHHLYYFLILELPAALADLQGMWYPTVRRTLVCLSKLYRCISVRIVSLSWWICDVIFSCWVSCKSFFFCPFQKETFEGLSQEALSLCIQSLKTASALITQRKVWNYLDLYLVYFVLCFSQAHRIYLISLIRYCPVRACLS